MKTDLFYTDRSVLLDTMERALNSFKEGGYETMEMEELKNELRYLERELYEAQTWNERRGSIGYMMDLVELMEEEVKRRGEFPEEYRTMDTEQLEETAQHLKRDIRRCEDVDGVIISDMMDIHHSMEEELRRRRVKKEKATELELENSEQDALFQQGNYRAMTMPALERRYDELNNLYEWSLKKAVGDEIDRRYWEYSSFSNKYLQYTLKHTLLDREILPERLHAKIDAAIENIRAVITERGEDAKDEPDFCYYRENPGMDCNCSRCHCTCNGCC